MHINSLPTSSFLQSLQSDHAICIIEPQGSFIHEVINLAIVEQMLNEKRLVVLVGSSSFIFYVRTTLLKWSDPALVENLKYVSLDSPKNTWGVSQLLFELRALNASYECTGIFFLSVSPFTHIAVALYNIGRYFRFRSPKNVSAVFHGFLANLLPRKERPDPYLYRNSRLFKLHPIRFLLQPKLTLALNNCSFSTIDFMVLSKHILDDLSKHKRYLKHFRHIEPPVKLFVNSVRLVNKPGIVRVLCLGRISPSDFNELLGQLASYCNSNIVLLVNVKLQSAVNDGPLKYINYVNLDTRREIVDAAKDSDILLMVRSKDESKLRLSGVPLESLALCRPIILPFWFSKLQTSINEKICFESYSNLQELANLLNNQQKLHEILESHTRLTSRNSL